MKKRLNIKKKLEKIKMPEFEKNLNHLINIFSKKK